MARLAADLKDFVGALSLDRPTVVGTSLGCAVIWAYVELYGDASLGKLVFVDQAPSQWMMPDWKLGSKGIYDSPSLANIQAAVQNMDAFADGNAECCLSKPPDAEVPKVGAYHKKLCTQKGDQLFIGLGDNRQVCSQMQGWLQSSLWAPWVEGRCS